MLVLLVRSQDWDTLQGDWFTAIAAVCWLYQFPGKVTDHHYSHQQLIVASLKEVDVGIRLCISEK